MLEQQDLQTLKNMMESVVSTRIAESENLLLEEMDRLQTNLTNRIEKLNRRMESMQHEVNACKLERESIGLLIKKIDQLESRIEELEKRTA